jgi:hypothetical protein
MVTSLPGSGAFLVLKPLPVCANPAWEQCREKSSTYRWPIYLINHILSILLNWQYTGRSGKYFLASEICGLRDALTIACAAFRPVIRLARASGRHSSLSMDWTVLALSDKPLTSMNFMTHPYFPLNISCFVGMTRNSSLNAYVSHS